MRAAGLRVSAATLGDVELAPETLPAIDEHTDDACRCSSRASEDEVFAELAVEAAERNGRWRAPAEERRP